MGVLGVVSAVEYLEVLGGDGVSAVGYLAMLRKVLSAVGYLAMLSAVGECAWW